MTITKRFVRILMLTSLMIFLCVPNPCAQEACPLSDGQTVYVPAYSDIYYGNKERSFLLTVTLSIRNIDPDHALKITVVDYYETHGELLDEFVKEPVVINPLGSARYVVQENEEKGGAGANFIVEWESDTMMNPPIIESIMIGARSGQGISFTSRGQAIYRPAK